MKNLVLCVPLYFLFFINIVYSLKVTPNQGRINFQPQSTVKLQCNVTYEGSDKPVVEWFKEAKKISSIDGLKDRAVPKWENNNVNVLTISPAREGDAGNYTCTAYDTATARNESANFIAARTIAVNVPNNINVVEEERLRIECEVKGNPELHWIYQNETFDKSRDRVILEDYTKDNKVIRNGAFIIEKITMEDRGTVVCVGEDLYTKETSEDECTVRIKDKYAALWPFLGICAEVIVLCAIIVIYEKKRNKTELEESDTDQSPDQKNTPDHGKEANLRHRQ